jgi:hypothetical protein
MQYLCQKVKKEFNFSKVAFQAHYSLKITGEIYTVHIHKCKRFTLVYKRLRDRVPPFAPFKEVVTICTDRALRLIPSPLSYIFMAMLKDLNRNNLAYLQEAWYIQKK